MLAFLVLPSVAAALGMALLAFRRLARKAGGRAVLLDVQMSGHDMSEGAAEGGGEGGGPPPSQGAWSADAPKRVSSPKASRRLKREAVPTTEDDEGAAPDVDRAVTTMMCADRRGSLLSGFSTVKA